MDVHTVPVELDCFFIVLPGTSASLSPLSSAARYTIAEAGGSNTIPLLMEMQDDLQVVCEDLRGDVSPTRLMRIGRRWEEARVRQGMQQTARVGQ